MEYSRLGKSGLAVSAVGLGCKGISDFCRKHDGNESLGALHRAIDLGVTLVDTAD